MSELDDELYRISEAARILKVHRTTIYNMIERKEIKVVKVTPDAPRIPRSEIERILRGDK